MGATDSKRLTESNELNVDKVTDINTVLPVEILEMIFSMLSPRDLKKVMAVCRSWKTVAEAPGFWESLCLTFNTGNLPTLPEVLGSKRLKSLERLRLKTKTEEVLRMVARAPRLRRVHICGTGLSTVSPDLLAEAVAGLEEVKLWSNRLTSKQLDALFETIKTNSGIKKINIKDNKLCGVDPGNLTRAVARLEEVFLADTRLTRMQADT